MMQWKVVAPIKVLYRMYRHNKSVSAEYEEFITNLDKIPDRLNPCKVIEGKVVVKEVLQDDLYKKIESWKRDVDDYIPKKAEIIAFSKDRYPSSEKSYLELKKFFKEDFDFDEAGCEYFCLQAFRLLLLTWIPQHRISRLSDFPAEFRENQKQVLKRSTQTIPVHAEAGKNTRNVVIKNKNKTAFLILAAVDCHIQGRLIQ